jgi:uncharacterized repeat protein (TIGR01451 family)
VKKSYNIDKEDKLMLKYAIMKNFPPKADQPRAEKVKNMKLFKNTIFILLATLLLLVKPTRALADCGSYFYGGPCVVNQISVNKMVQDPVSGNFVDNLGSADNKFNPGQDVIFRITVKNTGNQDLSGVQVRDVLPPNLNFISGPSGTSWDSGSRTFTFSIDSLKAGESKDFEVRAQVVDKNSLPANQSLVCVTNFVEAKTSNLSSTDTAGLCIQNVAVLPPTGPDTRVLLISLLTAVTGLFLVRSARVAA